MEFVLDIKKEKKIKYGDSKHWIKLLSNITGLYSVNYISIINGLF